jgi:FKBP-type peptidyl-prolyl cis-trans isomerase
MDVVSKIEKGDTTHSITIVRAGPDAEKFIVNDNTFKELVEQQWKKVNYEKENKKLLLEKYIADNYPNMTTLPDGLRYKILVQGQGNSPSNGSVVKVSYNGKLISGLNFASSADEGKPLPGSRTVDFVHTLGKDGLLKGLNEALLTMKSGEKRLLIVPPDLAYGINAGYYGKEIAGQKRFVISPGETLILEVTLIKFNQ